MTPLCSKCGQFNIKIKVVTLKTLNLILKSYKTIIFIYLRISSSNKILTNNLPCIM